MKLDLAMGESIIPVGLWSDAAPYSYDRQQSVKIVPLSFPCAIARNARILVCAWPKRWANTKTKTRVVEA
eukprot:212947-Amphidinium_carterae.1